MVTLGQDVAAALPALRAEAESLMTDRLVGVNVGESVWDESTGQYTDGEVQVYSGKGRLRFGNAQGQQRDLQGDETSTVVGILSLPVEGSADVEVGAIFTVQSSEHNPDNVGTKVRVTGVQPTTYATARRFQVDHYS